MPNSPRPHDRQHPNGLASHERWIAQAILMTAPPDEARQETSRDCDTASASLAAELQAQARAFLEEARRARDEALADRRRAAQELAQALEIAARTEALCSRARLAPARSSAARTGSSRSVPPERRPASAQGRTPLAIKTEPTPQSSAPAAA
jgi:hypothetical protein